MPKYILLIVTFIFSATALADESDAVPTMTPGQLKEFPFNQEQQGQQEKSKPPKVTALSFGQEYVLKEDRKDIKAFIALHLGILDLHGDKRDLGTIQQLIDRNVLKKKQVKQWQEVGVIFGDILANEFDLHWVSYQDDRGISTALQWRKTQNFVFPVTMFSKRIQFNEKLDAYALYNKISKDIKGFIAYENKNPKMPKQ